MSRSGYRDGDTDDNWALIRWRGAVASAIRGQRGDAFLHEMLAALDSLPVKELESSALIYEGRACALGAVAISRKIDAEKLEPFNDFNCGPVAADMAELFGIPRALAAEIMFENDEGTFGTETPANRFTRMRKWITDNIEANRQRAEGEKP